MVSVPSCSRSRRVQIPPSRLRTSANARRGSRILASASAPCCWRKLGNTGLEPLVRHETQSLRRDRLSWVSQNYQRDETLRAANALVAAQTGIPLGARLGRW